MSRNDDFHGNDEIDRSNAEEFEGSSVSNEVGLEERLAGILVEGGDGDLLLQWLQAIDMQVMGACRADERLKPLLKMNASNDAAEGRLLAQLTQHFELAEVGMLARCFCIPLVSVRVGEINKQGFLLCPTNSKMKLSFTRLNADWKGTTLLYEQACQAATGFRIAKDYEKAKDALEIASK